MNPGPPDAGRNRFASPAGRAGSLQPPGRAFHMPESQSTRAAGFSAHGFEGMLEAHGPYNSFCRQGAWQGGFP